MSGRGLVGGEGFAVDASLIAADANKQRSVPGEEWRPPQDAGVAVREYLERLDDAAFGAASEVRPRNSIPGSPRNMSVCSLSRTYITPFGSASPTASPVVRSKSWRVIFSSGASGAGPVVTVIRGRSLSKAMNRGTSPGRAASALASISSSVFSCGSLPDEATPPRA